MRIMSLAIALGIASGFLPLSLSGQTTLDEGTFLITVNGSPSGTESFSIRHTSVGAEALVFATAEVDMQVAGGRLDMRPALRMEGRDMAVTGYQVKISGQQQQEIFLELGDNRFVTRIHSERGEQQREYRAAPGTLLLDTGMAHQYYFVSARIPSGGGAIPVMVPREGRQYDLAVTEVGTETITVAQRSVQARHLRLEGNQEVRDLWVDSEGRVLRVDHPASGYSAVREAVP